MAGFSDVTAKKIVDHITGKATFAAPAAQYLALVTVAVTDADTGSTITEAGYTGYGRKLIGPADMTSAAGTGSNVEAHNSVQELFANCTAGTSTVIGWALCDAITGGNILMFGTCASTVISTTQTPPTVAASQLSLKAD